MNTYLKATARNSPILSTTRSATEKEMTMENKKQASKEFDALTMPISVKLVSAYVILLGLAMLTSYVNKGPFTPAPFPLMWLFMVGIVTSPMLMGIPLIILQVAALRRKIWAVKAVSAIIYIVIAEQAINLFYQSSRGMSRTFAGFVALFVVMAINIAVVIIMRKWGEAITILAIRAQMNKGGIPVEEQD